MACPCVYLCLYVHMFLLPCMCLLSWQRPAIHSRNIDGCRHVILHISSSYGWKMKCKKAPGITFVSHHIWVCILIYKYFKSVFLGLVWAVNVNVSSAIALHLCLSTSLLCHVDNDVLWGDECCDNELQKISLAVLWILLSVCVDFQIQSLVFNREGSKQSQKSSES